MKDIALITSDDLSLVNNNALNELQLKQLLKATPLQYVKTRPAKGGGTWKYVTGGYVRKCLNIMFGWDWDFEIIEHTIEHGEAIVKGKLTCRVGDRTIIKMQYGNKDVMCKKADGKPLSIGNDLKAAATDALKKCAAELGIAADIYNAEDFREVNVTTGNQIPLEDIEMLFESVKESLSDNDKASIQRIIENEETTSYAKTYKKLNQLANKL